MGKKLAKTRPNHLGKVRFLGGTASAIFRFGAYVYCDWLPGTFAPVYIPLFFALYALSLVYNNYYLPPQEPIPLTSTSTSKKALTSEPDPLLIEPASATSTAFVANGVEKPSYATVTAAHTVNEKPEDVEKVQAAVAATPNGSNGSVARRRKRKQSSNSSSTDSDSETALHHTKPPRRTGALSFSSILFGTPSSSPLLNLFSFALNVFLLSCVLDSLWSPVLFMNETDLSFARVGAVSHDSVKIVARVPPPMIDGVLAGGLQVSENVSTTKEGFLTEEVVEARGAKVAYRPTRPLGKWIIGPEIDVSEEKDWTGVVKLEGLYASTEYEYRLLFPGPSNTHHPLFPSIQSFTTFPDPALTSPSSPGAGTHYTFAASSCVKPGFPYRGPGSKRDVKGAEWLLNEVESAGLKFVMFLGDLIYVDTPYYSGPTTEEYHKKYRQILAAPKMKAVFEKIPFITIWDDHEIYNDFSASTPHAADRYLPAETAFDDYFGKANPDPSMPGAHYFEFGYGDSAFFVWDARSYRSANGDEDKEGKTMLGAEQKQVFFDWLARVNQTTTFKFVVSSTPFMSLWDHSSDTWSAFLTERDELMDVMQYVPNIIIISGDRHEFAAASIRTTVTEFSTSPLSQFYLPIRTLHQSHNRGATGEDILLKYLPDGNSKFTTFEVDTRVANQPQIRVKVVIDGKEAWNLTYIGQQLEVKLPGSAIGGLGKSLLELLGFKKRSWF